MPLKVEGFEPIQGRSDDPRRRVAAPTPAAPTPVDKEGSSNQPDTTRPSPAARTASPRRPRDRQRTEPKTEAASNVCALPTPDAGPAANVYARAGRPVQVAVSLYVPMWERAEDQCDELRAMRVGDATVTAWVNALLHFRAPTDPEAARELAARWRRVEADDLGPYGGLRKQARGVRGFEPLWERQRSTVTELRQTWGGERRPNLAMWTCAVCHFQAPRSSDEARQLLRDWRLLLAGDDPEERRAG